MFGSPINEPPSGKAEPRRRGGQGEALAPPVAAVVVAIGLYALLPDSLLLGPRLLVPAVEVVLLGALLTTNPRRITRETRTSRAVSLVLAAVVVGTNLVALGLLVAELVAGRAEQPGPPPAGRAAGVGHQRDRVRPDLLGARPRRSRGARPPRPRRPAAGGLAVLPGRERRRRHRGRDERRAAGRGGCRCSWTTSTCR